ncbi:2-oxoacid:acceptor oxidoreductase family protein [Yinghuangia aomiensis]
MTKQVKQIDRVVIRFAGDSGDGMQLTGDRFTSETASFGNDLSTLPNFPAEIRAPAGTLPGVSSFQLHFADHDILTPGDAPTVLVAMNPAALKANIRDLPRGAEIIVNTDEFSKRAMARSATRPTRSKTARWTPTTSTRCRSRRSPSSRSPRSTSPRRTRSARRTCSRSACCRGCTTARPGRRSRSCRRSSPSCRSSPRPTSRPSRRAGTSARPPKGSRSPTRSRPPLPAGTYRNITGNLALAYGLVAAGQRAELPVYLGSYPITPASDILHELAKHKNFDVRTFQAEDEIAGIGAALGAAFGGALGITTTSGPGVALKSEAIGLAVSLELPLLIVDVQRGGPSTGLPTKTEQSDLLQAMFGRNGEAPVPIVAPRTAGDCFDAAIEAARIALKYRTPVFLLSDGYLANGSEHVADPERRRPARPARRVRHRAEPRERRRHQGLLAVQARPGDAGPPLGGARHARSRTPHRRHREGRRHRHDQLRAANHDFMVRVRQAKVDGIAKDIAELEVDDPTGDAKVLVVGWGSTYGPIAAGVRRVRAQGGKVAPGPPAPPQPLPRRTPPRCSRSTTR